MPSVLENVRGWLLRGVQAVLGLTFVLALAGAVWGLLSLLGDDSGAAVARGVVLIGGILWLVVLAMLVVLLAWDRIAADRSLAAPVNPEHPTDLPRSSFEPSSDAAPAGDMHVGA